jgi:hypothetical protein
MKAIVLTYDERMPLAELTIQSYMKFWPNSGLTFRVPYNGDSPKTHFQYDNVEFIKCNKFIKPTVEALLGDVPDDEWIYWCFDDCYVHDILERPALNGVKNFLDGEGNSGKMDSFRLIRFHDEYAQNHQVNFGGMMFDLKKWGPFRFWFHQFVRAGVMKTAFLDNNLPATAKISHIEAKRSTNPRGRHNVYVPTKDICVLGETSRGGMLTQNCVNALEEYEIPFEKYTSVPGVILNGADVNNSGMSSSVKNKNYLKRYL